MFGGRANSVASALAYGGGIATLVGCGIGLWQVSRDVWAEATYVLLLVAGLVTIDNRRAQRELETQDAEATLEVEQLKRSIAALEVTTSQGRQSRQLAEGLTGLTAFLTQEPILDTFHHYDLIREEYVTHNHDGTYTWYLRGHNATADLSSQLVLKVSGDTALDTEAFVISAHNDEGDRAPLVTDVVADYPLLKVCAIRFREPLAPMQKFAIKVSCRWPNAFLPNRAEDYVFLPWGHYAALGVDRLEGLLRSDLPILDSTLERLVAGSQTLPEPGQPRHQAASGGRDELEWCLARPVGVYLVRFTRRLRAT